MRPVCSGSLTGCAFDTAYSNSSKITLDAGINPSFEIVNRDLYSYSLVYWTSDSSCGANCVFYSCEIEYEVSKVD